MYKDSLIVGVVSNVFEEDATSEGRYLERSDVNVGMEGAPCVGAYGIGDEGAEQTVEVEEEEDSQDAANQQFNQKDPTARQL